MKNVRYLDVDTHSSHGLLKFGGMKDLTLVTVREISPMKIVHHWKYMADTIQWLKVELQRGREEGGCPHVRLASFVEPQYISIGQVIASVSLFTRAITGVKYQMSCGTGG
jgi:hypothetical protein